MSKTNNQACPPETPTHPEIRAFFHWLALRDCWQGQLSQKGLNYLLAEWESARAGDQQPAMPETVGIKALASASGYESLLNAAKRLIEDERFDYFANTNCPKGQEDDGVRLWNDLVLAIHAADPEYDS